MTSKIVVNNIEADTGISTITFTNEVTAPTFNGNIVGTAATFSGNVDIAGALTYEDVTNVDSVGIITAQAGIHVTGGSVGIGTNNPAEALEVYGDARFKAPDGSHGIELFSDIGSLGYQRIISWNRTTSVYENLSIGANDLIIGPNFERLRITSAGLVGIGITNPDRKLVISQANSTAYSGTDFDQDYNVLKLNNTTDSKTVGMQFLIGSNGEAAITATEASDGATDLIFGTRGGGSRAERLRINSDGTIRLKSDGTAANKARFEINEKWNNNATDFGIDFKRTYDVGGDDQDAGFIHVKRNGGASQSGMSFGIGNKDAVSEKLIITSGGMVGINTTTGFDTSVGLAVRNGVSGSDHTMIDIIANTNETSRLVFSDDADHNHCLLYTSDAADE